MIAAAKRGLLISLLVFLVGCDHATKAAAQGSLAGGRVVTVIKGLLDLRYAQNFDTAFSLTRGWSNENKSLWLTLTALVTTITLVGWAYVRREHAGIRERVGVTLILAGALGNLTDRLMRGFVVDFIHLTHWPVFNVADMLVVVGVGLVAVSWPPSTPLPSSPLNYRRERVSERDGLDREEADRRNTRRISSEADDADGLVPPERRHVA